MSGHQQRMPVGFVGNPGGMTGDQMVQLRWLLAQIEPTEVHHGDGQRADAQFHEIACSLGISTIIHPSTDIATRAFSEPFTRRFEPRMSDERNQDIVKDSMILIVATVGRAPTEDHSEVWEVVQKAREAGSLIVLIFPDGTWELEKSYETSNDAVC
jgi:hypothetical protein